MSSRRSSGANAPASTASPAKRRSGRGAAEAAVAEEEKEKEKEQSARGGKGKGKEKEKEKRAAAAEDEFGFDMEDEKKEEDGQEEVEESEPRGRRGTAAAGRSSSSSSSAAKGAAPAASPARSASKGKGTARRTNKEEEEEEETKEEEDSAAVSSSLSRRLSSGASSSASAGVPASKEERQRLMDAAVLKAAMADKDALIKHLKKLTLVLGAEDQPRGSSERGFALAAALIDAKITKNRSQEVRILAALCLADLFRLFAPTTPFKEDSSLRAAFRVFESELTQLSDPSHPESQRFFLLLETLVTTKMLRLLCNRDAHSDQLIIEFFQVFFAVAKVTQHSPGSTILQHFVQLMSDILESCDPLPPLMLDVLLRQLTRAAIEANNEAAQLAMATINRNYSVLDRPLLVWLKGVLVDHHGADEVDTAITDVEDQQFVFLQLFMHCNDSLDSFRHYAADLLEDADDESRQQYTQLFLHAFCNSTLGVHSDTMARNQLVFHHLLVRFKDARADTRAVIAGGAGELLLTQKMNAANAEEIISALDATIMDKEESVRVACIGSIERAGLEDPSLLPGKIIAAVCHRAMDRKCMAKLFAAHVSTYWRHGQSAPPSSQPYRSIARKLLLTAKLDTHALITVDSLLDEVVLGVDASVEERTRCLTGLLAAIADRKPDERVSLLSAPDPLLNDPDKAEPRRAFVDCILGRKAQMHAHVNELLQLQQRVVAASKDGAAGAAAAAEIERVVRQRLGALVKWLHLASDGTVEDTHAALRSLFFDVKDKNIHKYLRVLSSPLTEYEQMRIARLSLVSAVKSAASANTGAGAKAKKERIVMLTQRLAALMSTALLPIESVQLLLDDVVAHLDAKRAPLAKCALDLLLLAAKTFPKLLSHPLALNTALTCCTHSNSNDQMRTCALELISLLPDQSHICTEPKHKKTAANMRSTLTDAAQQGTHAQAQFAVESIHKHLGSPVDKDGAPADVVDTPAAHILAEVLSAHVSDHLSLDEPLLHTALVCAANIARLAPEVLQREEESRKSLLHFVVDELLPSADISALAPQRDAGIRLVRDYLIHFGKVSPSNPSPLIDSKSLSASDAAISPPRLFNLLLRILRLDGRFPVEKKTPAEQLEEAMAISESDSDQDARAHFLLETATSILDLVTLPLFHANMVHAPKEAMELYERRAKQAAKEADAVNKSLLSPKAAPPRESTPRFGFPFATLAFVAHHPLPELSRAFLAHVSSLLRRERIPFGLYTAILTLGCRHGGSLSAQLHTTIIAQARKQKHMALVIEAQQKARVEREQATKQTKLDAAAAAVTSGSGKKKKKGSGGKGRKKKGEEGEEEEEEEPRNLRTANACMPEFAIADLIYLLSYDESWQNMPAKPTRDEVSKQLDSMLVYIDFLLDALLHDSVSVGGAHYDLLINILQLIRVHEDVRDQKNSRVWQLAELAIWSVQQRSRAGKWSNDKFDRIQISPHMWRPKLTSTNDKYLPAFYQPNKRDRDATADEDEDEEMGDEGSNRPTPKRKKRSAAAAAGGESGRKRHKSKKDAAADEEDAESAAGESEASGSVAAAAGKKSSSKQSSAKRAQRVEATPTRERLSRGAKGKDVKYTEGDSEDEQDEDEEQGTHRHASSSSRSSSAKRAQQREEEDEDMGDAEEEEDEDKMRDESPPPSSKKKTAAATPTAKSSSSKKKAAAAASPKQRARGRAQRDDEESSGGEQGSSDEEEEKAAPRNQLRKSAESATSASLKQSSMNQFLTAKPRK